MYEPDLALNNLPWLICHKTKPNHPVMLLHSLSALHHVNPCWVTLC